MTEADRPGAADDELARLRAQVAEQQSQLAQLHGQLATATGTQPTQPLPPVAGRVHRELWRSITAIVLITLACLLAPLSVVSVWAKSEVGNTDRYVQTVSPLARNPDVQGAITNAVTNQIFTYVDIKSITSQALGELGKLGVPPAVASQLQGLTTPIANGVQGFVHDQVSKIVASPAFATAWDEANRSAHTQMVNLLEGKQGGAVSAKNDTVSLNLGPFIAQVKSRLVAQGLTIANNIPEVNTSFTLFQSKDVTKIQAGYRLLNTLGTWLPFIALALFGIGVYVAKDHRKAIIAGSIGVAVSMLLLGAGIAIGRSVYLNSVPSDVLPHDAASAVFDDLVRFLRSALRATAAAAVIIAIAAFFTGGTVTAVRSRRALTHGIGWLRGSAERVGLRTGPVGTWVYARKRWLRVAIVVIALVVIVLPTAPTVNLIIVTAVVALLAVGIVEFLGRPPEARAV